MAVQTCTYTQFPYCSYDFKVHGTGYHIQDFADSAVNLIPESSALLEPGAASSGLPLPDCGLPDFPACSMPPIPSLQASHPQDSLCYPSPALPQPLPQPPQQEDFLWRDVAEQHHQALGEALDTNNQLQFTLNQRQEEIASLRERNLHLKELANKAKHLASILNRLISPAETLPPAVGSPSLKSPMKRRRLEDLFESSPVSEEVNHILRDVSERCKAVLGDSRLQQDPEDESHCIKMYGAFEGLQTSTPRSTVHLQGQEDEEESTAFRTSIRDHCTIRTLAFPQGNAFTSRVPQGGYRFRWVPS